MYYIKYIFTYIIRNSKSEYKKFNLAFVVTLNYLYILTIFIRNLLKLIVNAFPFCASNMCNFEHIKIKVLFSLHLVRVSMLFNYIGEQVGV